MTDKKMPKNAKQFVCEICNVVCCKNSNYKIATVIISECFSDLNKNV